MEPINNNEKVFLVTGTSTGLGLSIVQKLLENDYKVAAFTRSKKTVYNNLEKLFKDNTQKLTNLLTVQVDITSEESVNLAVQETLDAFGHLDVVINNAGASIFGHAEEVSDRNVREIFDINLFSVYNILRATVPILRKQRSGLILNVSSVLGNIPYGGFSSYTASKFALTGLTLSLKQELEQFNVKVVLLSPGVFKTDILNESKVKVADNVVQDYYQKNSYDAVKDSLKTLTEQSGASSESFANAVFEIFSRHQKDQQLPSNIFFTKGAIEFAKGHFGGLLNEIDQFVDISNLTN